MCSYAIFRNVSILLTIVIALPSIVVSIVVVYVDFSLFWLVLCPHRNLSTLKSFMTILLAIVVVTIKFWCPCSFDPIVLCMMSLLIAIVIVSHVHRFFMLIGILSCKKFSMIEDYKTL